MLGATSSQNIEKNLEAENVNFRNVVANYLPLGDRYLINIGVCQLPQMKNWQIPNIVGGVKIKGLLVNQPNCWGLRAGNKKTKTSFHADDWGACYSIVAVFCGEKRLIICKNEHIPEHYMDTNFPLDLDMQDMRHRRVVAAMGGVNIYNLRAGEMCIFQSKYPHASMNVRDNTVSTTGVILTMNSMDLIMEDIHRMPRRGTKLVWFGSVLHCLQKELKHHLMNNHLTDDGVKAIVCTIRDSLEESSAMSDRGRLRRQFASYNAKKLKEMILGNEIFRQHWPKCDCK